MFWYSVFYGQNEEGKEKKKNGKKIDPPHWDSNPRFLNKTFPPKIWILREIRSIELTVLKKFWLYLLIFFQKYQNIPNMQKEILKF